LEKLAIVCGSPSSDYLAPFDTHEIWILGNQAQRHEGKRIAKIFELHDNLSEHDERYPEYLHSLNIPMIVGDNGLKGERFPYDALSDLIGSDEYFTSSPACMLAYAILRGYKDVSIYGVDMAVDDHEYFMQRPCMEGWIGYARGVGVKITIPDQSPLMKYTYREGRDWNGTDKDLGNKPFTMAEFQNMEAMHEQSIAGINQEIAVLQAKIQAHDGARQAYSRMRKVARAVESGNNIQTLSDSAAINGTY
jgi:hypothetical protein